MLKKPNILYVHRSHLLTFSFPLLPPPPQWSSATGRLYATSHGGFSEKDLSWPSTTSFTPYDVFKQDRKAPYSKSRFYELVKIYHPDRPCNDHPLCRDLSPELRLHRYRVLVAAHEILSDPTKRAAYDQSGTGWALHPSGGTHAPTPSWARTGSSDYGPIYANATWEDWERWYNRDAPKQQQLVDHRTFATFVILLVLLGGAMQASWIGKLSSGYENRLQEINEESARFLVERRRHTMNQMASSDAKVQHFLVRRDPSGYGLKEEEQSVYQTVLNPRRGSGSTSTGGDIGTDHSDCPHNLGQVPDVKG